MAKELIDPAEEYNRYICKKWNSEVSDNSGVDNKENEELGSNIVVGSDTCNEITTKQIVLFEVKDMKLVRFLDDR